MPYVSNPFIPSGGTYRAPSGTPTPVVGSTFVPSTNSKPSPAQKQVQVNPHPVYGTSAQVVLPASALKALVTINKTNPTLFRAALRAVPPPKTQPMPGKRGMHGLGDTTTDSTATPAATSDWLSSLSSFVTTNLPSYLNYNVTKDQIAAGQAQQATAAQTQALLASHGIGVSTTGLSTTTLLLAAGGLVGLLLIMRKR